MTTPSFSKEECFWLTAQFIIPMLRMILWFLSDRCLTPISTSVLSLHLLIFWSVWQHFHPVCSIFSLGREDLNIPLFRGFIGTSDSWQWCMEKFCTATDFVFKDFHSKRSEMILFHIYDFFSFWFVCWNVIIVGGCYGCCATLLIMTAESYFGRKHTFHVFIIII